ncbi:YIP1 family protein (plasmid) [Rossellomorea sp. FS2]|uniref:YIP1 family protein n=1 Tax=Rossellomorea sp. FS2 TaxID=3391447 RepID=UPI003A4D7C0A
MQAQPILTNAPNQTGKPSLIKMIWSPVEQMNRIKETPNIMFALFIVTVLYTFGVATMALNYDMSTLLEDIPDVESNSLLFKSIVIGSAALSGLTTPLFNILASSCFFYIIAKIFKKSVTFRQIFSLNTYVMIIGVIGLLLNSLLLHTLNIEGIKTITSLSALVNNSSFEKLEIFTIWQTVVTGLGLYYVANFSKTLSWVISVVLLVLIVVAGYLFSGDMQGLA